MPVQGFIASVRAGKFRVYWILDKNLGGSCSQVFNYGIWNWLLMVFVALVEIPKQLALLSVTFFS